jgi:hypothetical protein
MTFSMHVMMFLQTFKLRHTPSIEREVKYQNSALNVDAPGGPRLTHPRPASEVWLEVLTLQTTELHGP